MSPGYCKNKLQDTERAQQRGIELALAGSSPNMLGKRLSFPRSDSTLPLLLCRYFGRLTQGERSVRTLGGYSLSHSPRRTSLHATAKSSSSLYSSPKLHYCCISKDPRECSTRVSLATYPTLCKPEQTGPPCDLKLARQAYKNAIQASTEAPSTEPNDVT